MISTVHHEGATSGYGVDPSRRPPRRSRGKRRDDRPAADAGRPAHSRRE
jgi:hypothetical protein